ncbi:16S rRNA pseudouridine(516) synthase [Akkermansiaceae bacterium]|nr:16S rRNA pseudouridine(516) synthase [Akkermansiaceae bacterium]MDB4434169.1 16S rRNA pseudouridine(516) synthase [Akkermansiaceae bacterium]
MRGFTRLDRLIWKFAGLGKPRIRAKIEAGEIRVNGEIAMSGAMEIGNFDLVEMGGEIVQNRIPRYLMLNKPPGVVSATIDAEHPTVIDLIKEPWAEELHLAGRLDRFTTGLLILTNDSRVSESITEPERKVGKRYRVGTDAPITAEMIALFKKGMWFTKEEVTTAPAQVELLDPQICLLTIYEGKHHQVKRMFAHFEVKVVTLHREAVGELAIGDLAEGEWRFFEPGEISLF